MGMSTDINKPLNVFRNDETLLRLLVYKPKSLTDNQPDPLSEDLPDILDLDEDELWALRDKHISTTSNSDDLSDEKLCRIYVYLGNRRPASNNYTLAEQEIIIDVLCHDSYQIKEQRMFKISDRLNELLIDERITGVTKIQYLSGSIIGSPAEY